MEGYVWGIVLGSSSARDGACVCHRPGSRTDLSPQDLQLLQKVADAVVSRRLETPAVLLLESSEPLNFLSSQIVHGLRPFLDLVCAPAETERLAGILERRDAVARLVELIHAQLDKRTPPVRAPKTGVSS